MWKIQIKIKKIVSVLLKFSKVEIPEIKDDIYLINKRNNYF